MIPRQSIAPGYGGMSSVVDISSGKQGESGNQGSQQQQQYQPQRMSSSGKQGGSKVKAAPGGSSTKKTQGVAGGFNQTVSLNKSPNEMLELNDIDLRLSENVVDSGKLTDIAQAKNLRSQVVDSGKI